MSSFRVATGLATLTFVTVPLRIAPNWMTLADHGEKDWVKSLRQKEW
jgi:hypothetical protein